MGITTLGRERATNPFLRELAGGEPSASRPRAGTFDVLPATTPRARARSRRTRARILERAGYGRIETPVFEATELFARGVGEATDIVQKEMYTFEDGGGRSLTLRPEGTAPVCRAYVEHGMHKLPQPVKLWYLGPLLPPRGARRRAATASSGRSAPRRSARDDPSVDAELILLLAELLEALGARRDAAARSSSLGTPETRADYRDELQALPARARGRALARGARAHRPQPAARVRRRPPGHAAR